MTQPTHVTTSSRKLTIAMVVLGIGLVATLVAENLWVEEQAGPELRYALIARGLLAGTLLMSGSLLLLARIAESAERSREETRDLLDTVTAFLDELPVAAFVVNAAGRPVYSNKASRQLLGRDIEDVAPDRLADVYQAYVKDTGEPYPTDRMPIIRALEGERGATATDMEIHIGDDVHALKVWANPVHDEQGQVRFAIAGFVAQEPTGS